MSKHRCGMQLLTCLVLTVPTSHLYRGGLAADTKEGSSAPKTDLEYRDWHSPEGVRSPLRLAATTVSDGNVLLVWEPKEHGFPIEDVRKYFTDEETGKLAPAGEYRTLPLRSQSAGTTRVKMAIVRIEDGQVFLRPDSIPRTFALDKLSKSDLQYLGERVMAGDLEAHTASDRQYLYDQVVRGLDARMKQPTMSDLQQYELVGTLNNLVMSADYPGETTDRIGWLQRLRKAIHELRARELTEMNRGRLKMLDSVLQLSIYANSEREKIDWEDALERTDDLVLRRTRPDDTESLCKVLDLLAEKAGDAKVELETYALMMKAKRKAAKDNEEAVRAHSRNVKVTLINRDSVLALNYIITGAPKHGAPPKIIKLAAGEEKTLSRQQEILFWDGRRWVTLYFWEDETVEFSHQKVVDGGLWTATISSSPKVGTANAVHVNGDLQFTRPRDVRQKQETRLPRRAVGHSIVAWSLTSFLQSDAIARDPMANPFKPGTDDRTSWKSAVDKYAAKSSLSDWDALSESARTAGELARLAEKHVSQCENYLTRDPAIENVEHWYRMTQDKMEALEDKLSAIQDVLAKLAPGMSMEAKSPIAEELQALGVDIRPPYETESIRSDLTDDRYLLERTSNILRRGSSKISAAKKLSQEERRREAVEAEEKRRRREEKKRREEEEKKRKERELLKLEDRVDDNTDVLDDHETRLVETEDTVDDHENRLGDNEGTLADHEGRILYVEEKVDDVDMFKDRVIFLEGRRQEQEFYRGRQEFSRGVHYFWEGRWDLAIERLRAATLLSPQWSHAYYFLAFAYACKGEKTSATKELEFALALDRRRPIRYWNNLMTRLQGPLRQQIERLRALALAGVAIQVPPDMWDAWEGGGALGIRPVVAVRTGPPSLHYGTGPTRTVLCCSPAF